MESTPSAGGCNDNRKNALPPHRKTIAGYALAALGLATSASCGAPPDDSGDLEEIGTTAAALTAAQTPSYHGGHVLGPELVAFYWGPDSDISASQIQTMNTYLAGLAKYMRGVISPAGKQPTVWQYQVYGASFASSFHDTSNPGSPTIGALKQRIQTAQSAGNLPAFNRERIFIAFTNNHVWNESPDSGGFHGAWPEGYYAVVKLERKLSGKTIGASNATITSHEVLEAATDPDPGTGWFGATLATTEVADVCSNSVSFVTNVGYVALIADRLQNNCSAWTPQTQPLIAPWSTYNPQAGTSEEFQITVSETFKPLERFRRNMQGDPNWNVTPIFPAQNPVVPAQPAVAGWPGAVHWFVNVDGLIYHQGSGVIGGSEVLDSGKRWIGQPTAVSWGPNRIDVFAQATTGNIMHTWCTGSCVGNFAAWEDRGGVSIGPPVTVSRGSNQLDIFVVGTNGRVYHMNWNGSGWSGWIDRGGRILSRLVAIAGRSAPNVLDVFGLGSNYEVEHLFFDGGASWVWENVGGTLLGPPAVAGVSAGTLHIFGQAVNTAYWHKWWDGAWHDWEPILGDNPFLSGPSATEVGGQFRVFGRGTDGVAYERTYAPGWPQPWVTIGNTIPAGSDDERQFLH